MTRSSAWSKSARVSAEALRRAQRIAASLARLARSAPVRPLVCAATFARSTSSRSGLSRVCTPRIRSRPVMSGGETNTWRSKRPGRSSAGSSFSRRLDAAMTTMSPVELKPSISTSSWLSVCSRSPEKSEPRELLGVAQELDDLAQLVLGVVDAGDVVPADRGLDLGLDLHRLRARHELQRP